MHYDVIIIGAGSMGMAAGYYLAKSGKKTLLLDSLAPPHNKGSHHGDTRIIRYAYGESEEYVPLALKAKKLWKELEEQTGKNLFLQTGVLNIGPGKSEFIQNVISSSKKYSLPLEVMDAREVHKKWPGIKLADELMGCYEPTSGVLKCEECIDAYQQLAIAEGATILTNTKVKDVTVLAEGVMVKTDGQEFHADSLIVSAGAWSGELLEKLNLKLPLNPVRKTVAWFEADEKLYNQNNHPAFTFQTSEGMYYGFPSIDGAGLKLGRHDGGLTINPDESIPEFGAFAEDEGDLAYFLNQHMPYTKQLKNGKTCIYTLTPDEDFILDKHPMHPNVAIAAGFSGHGFKFSSVVGLILSELMTKGESQLDISLFSINRFL